MRTPSSKGLALVSLALAAAVLGVIFSPLAASGSNGGPTYPRNAHGQTYGSGAAATDDSQLPDLIRVQADNGQVGYINKADFLSSDQTLQQVLSLPRDGNGNFVEPSRVVHVYAQDGVTQLGEFTIAAGQSGSSPRK